MIKATLLRIGQQDTAVEVLSADKESGTAVVTPLGWLGSGYFFDNAPEWHVDQAALIDVRMVCETCGDEFDPAGTCECGWDWREGLEEDEHADEIDGQRTQDSLREEYYGG